MLEETILDYPTRHKKQRSYQILSAITLTGYFIGSAMIGEQELPVHISQSIGLGFVSGASYILNTMHHITNTYNKTNNS